VSAAHLAIGILVVAVGASVQATIGFGASLFAVPLLLIIDPRFVPGPAIVASVALNVLMVVGHRAHTDGVGVGWMIAGLLPGAAVAGLALSAIAADDLAILSGSAILVAVAISVAGWSPTKRPATLLGAGVVSGFMGSTAAVSGPPLALLYQHEDGATIRGTLPPTFLVGSAVALGTLAVAGKLPGSSWWIGAALAPGGAVGYVVAGSVAPKVEGPWLRVAVLVVSGLSAAAAIVRAIA
jgi:uncharacterized membrane protein YfcA